MGEQLLKCSANSTAVFDQLLKQDHFVDCSLAAEGRTLKAHRAVLSAASPYFELLFTEEHERDPVIIFTNIRFNDLEAVLRLIYRGEVEVSEVKLAEFLKVLKLLQINGLDCKELVVRETNVTTCDDANSLITFDATTAQEASSFCEKVEGEVSVQELADNNHILKQNLLLEASSPTKPASGYSPNVLSMPPCEVKSVLGNFENGLSCSNSEPSFKYEFSDIAINHEQIHLNLKMEKDVRTIRNDDEPTLEDVNDDDRKVSPGPNDAELQFEDVQSNSADTNVGNGEELFKCPSCDFEASQKSYLNLHICQIVESPFQLSHAPLSSTPSGVAKNHQFNNLKGKRFKCYQCTYTCGRKSDLKRHESEHKGEKPFQCSQCTYNCNSKSNMKTHVQRHTREKPFKCMQCMYASNQKHDLIRHLHTHTGEKPLKCAQCTYACSQKQDLIKHMRTHTGEKPYKCSQCTYACTVKSNIQQHMHTHTGERPFKCSQCTYACSLRGNLRQHMRTHTGEKPYKCSQCTHACSWKSSMRQHMLRHTGEKPFQCSQCSFTCSLKHSLIRHSRIHTGQ